jgi:hypothetical protein
MPFMFATRILLPSVALLSGPVIACLATWYGLGGGEWLSKANVASAVWTGVLEGAVIAVVLAAFLSSSGAKFDRSALWAITGVQVTFGLAFATWVGAGASV